ncbi:MAG: ATP-binding protein [Bacteroidales bacterium]|nr:ATP-binding protein [Bacteroidales bacterium]
MNYFITNIRVNNLLHLNNFDIPIADEKRPHLIITGKNGSGKTILVNAIAEFLDKIKGDSYLEFLKYDNEIKFWQQRKNRTDLNVTDRVQAENQFLSIQKQQDNLCGKVNISFTNVADLIKKYQNGQFIFAFYQATRKPEMLEPKNPTKPDFKNKFAIKSTVTNQFLNFLSDLKIQEALARNENQLKDAEDIKTWFDDFEKLLCEIYQDDDLKLEFNYRDYSFRILTEGKSFKFTELSDGFSAILDIVADLILKMQEKSNVTRSYQKEGIVLIDEIETHLHLALQKNILRFLTRVFPNIQFIVTTHSPFVMNSCNNAVAYDLEHREILGDLNEYSYESLAEGYFGVETESSYAQMQLDKFRKILVKDNNTESEIESIRQFIIDFEKIPEAISPIIVGRYRQLYNEFSDKIRRYSK